MPPVQNAAGHRVCVDFLVLILLLVGPLASYLPTAAMAGILFLVAWGLIDFHHIAIITKTNRAEAVVLWVTLLGTLVDLEEGIFFGILLSWFYIYTGYPARISCRWYRQRKKARITSLALMTITNARKCASCVSTARSSLARLTMYNTA